MPRVAVVGMASVYPDADSPGRLWENALAGRRAFRRLPDERMRLADYWNADPAAPDSFYSRNAAVIEGYTFDRVAHRIAGSTYRSTDLTHWLALDVAGRALADAGFPDAEGLRRERTGVVVGNTLTGEFTRANLMRLRWPYVRRTVAAALREQGWDDTRLGGFLDDLEDTYKSPFPAPDEDTLAGGLSNTIAGRICNYFDLNGGGYAVDGACSSSLLSVSTACKALLDGDLDVAIAGGVDLSIDPFEIVGFAKTGALARTEMRVYDRNSNGFWPGEGCGMVVLMREPDAVRADRRVYATVAGWGISSDGRGGITRPEADGYRLALRRAYERAGFGIDTVPLFEGHGTGTEVGDGVELTALSRARADAAATAGAAAAPAVIGTVKGMIGHTKAAAGVAGLIKAVLAVHHRVLPPTVGCVDPHPVIEQNGELLRVLRKAEPWPDGAPPRAGITSMGFGGINSHVVVEGAGARRPRPFSRRTRALAASVQDAELLLVDGGSPDELRGRLAELADWVPTLSYAQLGDLAATLHQRLRDLPYRAALVVSSPEDAERGLRRLLETLDAGETVLADPEGRRFLGHASGEGRIGYLFTGQGSGKGLSGGALRRRFAEVEEVYERAALPAAGDAVATAVAQPRIATGSMAGLRALSLLGLEAGVAVGHSLGEISALHWAGAMDGPALLGLVGDRGRTMTEHSESGTMAGLGAPPDQVTALIRDLPVVIAAYNGPAQTVVAGPADAIEAAGARAAEAGVSWTRLAVSHAFHSPLVAPAADAFAAGLEKREFGRIGRRIISTVTGALLPAETDIPALLRRQITDPVLFTRAVELAAKDVDLFVEVGPGRVLSGLAAETTGVPAVALDTDDESLRGLLRVAGAAYVIGAPVDHEALFHDRLARPLEIGETFAFFASPCEQAPAVSIGGREAGARPTGPEAAGPAPAGPELAGSPAGEGTDESTLGALRRLVAERVELPVEMVSDDSRLLDDLHLSSITVGQVMNLAAQARGVTILQPPTSFATATLRELAETLDQLAETSGETAPAPVVEGAGAWARPFAVDLVETPPVRSPEPPPPDGAGPRNPSGQREWRLYAPGGNPLAEPLRSALQAAGTGPGVLVCLPEDCAAEHLASALEGVQAALSGEAGDRFVLVQHGRGAAGLAKTLRLEAPHLRVTIAHVPPGPEAAARVAAEVAATDDYAEVHYDADGVRRVPTLRAMPVRAERTAAPLDGSDVLLVTGGGKGITAECALALAGDTGARLAVLGRSDPREDAELAANLARMTEAGVTARYYRADVCDAAGVRAAVAAATRELGPVTAVLHGAGRNLPRGLTALDMDEVRATFAPKIDGLRTVLSAVGPERLRLLVTFGSIIGRAGLRGEGHYAMANEWLAALTRETAEQYPGCRALCLEWSVWSGVGMGERLAVVESLAQDGITPVAPDQGVQIMRRLLADPDAPEVVVVSGRTGTIDTVRHDRPELPLMRFLGTPLVRYHGVELVTEVELNAGTDLYLADHLLDGNLLFPAVFGMEAMAQAAAAVTGRPGAPVIEDAEFVRPIVVPPEGSTVIRVAAVVTDDDTVQASIRSAETGFAAEHFRARLRFGQGAAPDGPPEQTGAGLPAVPLDPAADLYGPVLFQGGRFQRLRRYHRAASRHVDAEVAAVETDWFAGYLPGGLLLGDPGVRDALMHGNQVCVPDATLLPTGIERIHPGGAGLGTGGTLRYCATERLHEGDTYVYDIAVRNGAGEVVERWEGLHLQAVRKGDGRGPWAAPLLGPFLERAVEDITGTRVALAVEPDEQSAGAGAGAGDAGDTGERRRRTAVAARRALDAGAGLDIRYRPDGRPEIDGDRLLSASHGAGVTLCAVAGTTVGCDVESATERTAADWAGLLGRYGDLAALVAKELDEDAAVAGTRVWTAIECLRKAGLPMDAPLALAPRSRSGWAVLASGDLLIATFATSLNGRAEPAVFAILTEGRS
ncbi:SDR family NAD(P)-dependent oxidoreductase [Actinomadura xylanilytica]|uniref:type I polyketide synthase n=1 Tax=Actinomadura xylanilytica TaxID=887459 RepID=UPI00255B400D|nr:type I polyketide synthase [Actinomadura xylanilytica]MDL4777349.1 type I polyketide synthase [Actinomadura xylanilytica]